jgi:hypothetical protein
MIVLLPEPSCPKRYAQSSRTIAWLSSERACTIVRTAIVGNSFRCMKPLTTSQREPKKSSLSRANRRAARTSGEGEHYRSHRICQALWKDGKKSRECQEYHGSCKDTTFPLASGQCPDTCCYRLDEGQGRSPVIPICVPTYNLAPACMAVLERRESCLSERGLVSVR